MIDRGLQVGYDSPTKPRRICLDGAGLLLMVIRVTVGVALALLCWVRSAQAAPPPPPPPTITEDVRNTKHNLSSTPSAATRNVFTTATSEICVFCHTPHGASQVGMAFGAPIWNRHLSTASYTLYDNTWSFSLEAQVNTNAPTGYSRLCLSCHDGTIAIGSVLNAPGSGGYLTQIPMTNGAGPGGTMPLGPGGELTGDTRRLGTNLRNDHPISIVFDSALVTSKDPEFNNPGPPPPKPSQEPLYPAGIGPLRRYGGDNPAVYDSVQCVSCHNPHAVTYPKFLRAPIENCANASNPCPGTGLSANSQGQMLICLFCHNKDLPSGNSYSTSTHALSMGLHNTYPSAANYPANPGYDYDGVHNVGQASCRNCHDPHTAQGAIRIHREGVDTPGGGDAIENTCYLCHSPGNTTGVIQPTPFGQPTLPAGTNTGFEANGQRIAPDIYSQFAKDHNLGINSPCDQTPVGAPPKPAAIAATAQTDCGSAMNLKLDDALGPLRAHQPFFIKLPQEGVEFNNPPPPIVGNENPAGPGISQPDDMTHRHIECVDCHNPHQVTNPSVNPAGRLKGMKGITFNDKVVGIETTETGCSPGPCGREPYVYEVCFRCHGNAVPTLFQGDDNPGSTLYRSNPRPGALASNPNLSYQGFSNKRLEFATYGRNASNEVSTDVNPTGGSYEGNSSRPRWTPPQDLTTIRYIGPGINKAFHPVVGPGRNGSVQLFNQLKEAFGLTAQSDLQSLTIQCTDCHNNNYYDRFTDPSAFGPSTTGNVPPPPEGSLISGPLTESSLRSTDRAPHFNIPYWSNGQTDRVAQPIGPHGSQYIRLLRARYNTDIANSSRNFFSDGFSPDHFNNFLLCFQCHDRRAFDPNWTGANPADTSMTNFFGNPVAPLSGGGTASDITAQTDQPGNTPWDLNLHMYHLVRTGAYCHECHYNVHSNAQARNTIYGDGTDCVMPSCSGNAGLPPDDEDGIMDGISDTHLINFSIGGPTTHTGHQPVTVSNGSIPCIQEPFGSSGAVNDPNACFDWYQQSIEGVTAPYPVWYYDGDSSVFQNNGLNAFRCNLRCHGVVMATCFYRPLSISGSTGENVSPGDFWCAGGQAQRASQDSGAL